MKKLKQNDIMDAGLYMAGGAAAGAASFEINKYASTVNAKTGKANMGFLANNPYITGFAFAAVGFGVAAFAQNMYIKKFGVGVMAGGAAEGAAELVNHFEQKSLTKAAA